MAEKRAGLRKDQNRTFSRALQKKNHKRKLQLCGAQDKGKKLNTECAQRTWKRGSAMYPLQTNLLEIHDGNSKKRARVV